MKKLLSIMLRFFLVFLVADLCLVVFWTASAILDTGTTVIGKALAMLPFAAIPAAVMVGAFVSFFMLNRLFGSRIAGYLIVIVESFITLGAVAVVLKMVLPSLVSYNELLPTAYRNLGTWFLQLPQLSWVEIAASIGAVSVFISGFWFTTRLVRKRSIVGAFAAPGGVIAAIYLFSLYASGPVDAVFALAGLNVSRTWSTVILCSASALAMMLVDILVAGKPSGGRRDE